MVEISNAWRAQRLVRAAGLLAAHTPMARKIVWRRRHSRDAGGPAAEGSCLSNRERPWRRLAEAQRLIASIGGRPSSLSGVRRDLEL